MRIVFMGTPDFAAVSLQRLLDERFDVVGVFTCLLYTSDAADE